MKGEWEEIMEEREGVKGSGKEEKEAKVTERFTIVPRGMKNRDSLKEGLPCFFTKTNLIMIHVELRFLHVEEYGADPLLSFLLHNSLHLLHTLTLLHVPSLLGYATNGELFMEVTWATSITPGTDTHVTWITDRSTVELRTMDKTMDWSTNEITGRSTDHTTCQSTGRPTCQSTGMNTTRSTDPVMDSHLRNFIHLLVLMKSGIHVTIRVVHGEVKGTRLKEGMEVKGI